MKNQLGAEEKRERKFINPNTISKHLICVICQDVLDDPKRINCGHTFCNLCIFKWRQKNSFCPNCRKNFTQEEGSRDLIAFNIINDLEVFCIYKSKYFTRLIII